MLIIWRLLFSLNCWTAPQKPHINYFSR